MKTGFAARLTFPALLLLASMVVGCAPQEAREQRRAEERAALGQATPPQAFETPVLAQRLTRRPLAVTVGTTGSVVPKRSLMLRAEEAGRLHYARAWREGDEVTAGTLIARIDSDSLTGEINRARADLEIQRENVIIGRRSAESARREFEIIQDLYARGIAPLRDVETQQLSLERAINTDRQNRINLERSQAELAALEMRLERLEIRAPFDGLLVAASTLDGTRPFTTSFGQEPLTNADRRLVSAEFPVAGLIDQTIVLLRCDVTSRDIDRIRLGQRVGGLVFGTSDLPVSGVVDAISRSVSADTRAFTVDVLVENNDDLLRPGMFGRVEIVVDEIPETIVIARSLLRRREGENFVFVVELDREEERFFARQRRVIPGLESRDEVEILEGLSAGEVLIIRGFELLQDRTPVAVLMEDGTSLSIDEEKNRKDP